MTNFTAIIQARMTSTRLPGKVLLNVLDKPLIEYLIERLNRSGQVTKIIIATTTNEDDNPIRNWCNKHHIDTYSGSELDVLARYYECAKQYNTDTIIRITSDCPLFDHRILDSAIEYYRSVKDDIDYLSNGLIRTFPRGMDFEIFPFSILENAYRNARNPHEREHVTPFIYENRHKFRCKNFSQSIDQSQYRLTVDTIEDFELVSTIIKSLYPTKIDFALNDIMDLFRSDPSLELINRHIEQKKLTSIN